METRSGKVVNTTRDAKVSPRTGKPYTVHGVELDSGEQIEIGFKQAYKVGDSFNSEVEFAYGKWKEKRALGSAPIGATTVLKEVHTPPTAMAFPIPKANKETAIIRQNALTNAVKACDDYAEHTGKLLPLDEFIEQVISVAYKFAEFSSGQREIRMSKELVGDQDN